MVSRIVIGIVAVLVVTIGLAGCTMATTSSANSSAIATERSSLPAIPAGTITVKCTDGSTGVSQATGQPVFGVYSDVWSGQVERIDLKSSPLTYNGLIFVKSPLYVSKQAKEGTRVQVVDPASAGLYYTDWTTWQGSPTAKSVVLGARRAIEVGGCDPSPLSFPGGIIVDGPSCVTLRVSAASGSTWQDVRVPVGRNCNASTH